MDIVTELERLIRDIEDRVKEPRPAYTKGYLDCLEYVLWMVENDE